MSSSTFLFENSSIGIDGVLRQVRKIFTGHWMPLMTITALKIITFSITSGILGLFTFLLFFKYIDGLVKAITHGMDGMPNSMNANSLRDYYSSGASVVNGKLRSLSGGKPYVPPEGDDFFEPFVPHNNITPDIVPEKIDVYFVIVVIGLVIVWTVVLSLVLSTFAGAMYHSIAQIYAGDSPSPFQAIKRGYAKKYKIYGFINCLAFTFILITFLTVALPGMILSKTQDISTIFGTSALMYMIYFAAVFILCTATIAAIPAIVVEDKTSFEAFERSVNLCRRYICFIFCTNVCYRIAMAFGLLIISFICALLGPLGGLILVFVVPVVMATIEPV